MKTALLAAFLVAGQATDITTTCVALRSGRFTEANPILPRSCGRITAIKSAITALNLGTALAMRHRHPKWALAMFIIPGTAGFAAAGVNLHIMLGETR
jgi:hypothetical protein